MTQSEGRVALAARGSRQPRVRVAALMLLDGQVVTVRHRAGDSVYHLLPGGGVDYRETLHQALLREIREETGLEAEIGPVLFINDTIDPQGTRHLVNITFSATISGGAITDTPDDERIEAVDLVSPADLGLLDMRPPITEAILGRLADGGESCTYLGSVFTRGA